jgi:exosortase A
MEDAETPMVRSRWRIASGAGLLAVAGILALDFEAVVRAVEVWASSKTYNHAFLVLPICAYLAWERRDVLRQVDPAPFPLALVGILPFALAWLLARFVSVLEAEQFALMGMAQVSLLAVLGLRAYRAAMFPLLYALFLVPSGDFLVRPLQDFTAAFAVGMLKLTGVPVYSDGIIIEVPAGTFVVAEACAGLRFLVASIAYGVLFAGLMYGSWRKRLIFVAASIIVPVIANGFRAYGLIALAQLIDDQAAVDADHIVYGWGFFAAVTLLLTLAGVRYRENFTPPVPPGPSFRRTPAAPFIATAVGAVFIAALAPGYLAWGDRDAEAVAVTQVALPDLSGWATATPDPEYRPEFGRPHAEAARGYASPEGQVDVFVGYFARQSSTRKLPRSLIGLADEGSWRRAGSGVATVDLNGEPVALSRERVVGRTGERVVWAVYWINGRFTASPLQAKLGQLKGELLGGRRDAAVIVIAAGVRSSSVPPEELLSKFAGNLATLRAALAARH